MGIACLFLLLSSPTNINMQIEQARTVDSLGACQGASLQQGRLFLYGDREVGIREYKMMGDSPVYINKECKLTEKGGDVIKVINLDHTDELEGFTFLDDNSKGIAVSSSGKDNVNNIKISWK